LKELPMRTYSLKDGFKNSFNLWGEKPVITFFRNGAKETELTYAKLDHDSNQLAHVFVEHGVKKEDRVIFYIEKSLIAVVAHIAVQKIGAVAVPLNPGFKKTELAYLLSDADASLILAEPDKKDIITRINPHLKIVTISTQTPYQSLDFFRSYPDSLLKTEIRPENPGLIIYTSGTTGRPKGAVLNQQNLIHDAQNIISIWEISESDVLCHTLPLFHIHGLCFALNTTLLAGSHILMLDQFDPDTILKLIARTSEEPVCTLFMGIPTMYAKIMDALGDTEKNHPNFSHIRLLTSGSAPLLVSDFKRIEKMFGKSPVEREGMSETGMNFSNPLLGKRKPGSIGLPMPGLEVRIVDPTTLNDVTSGQTGEIWLKGPGISKQYWRKPEETKESFVDGWFRTGDLGRVDDEGYYYLTDRIKDIIISGGENVSAKEVENVINELKEVVESSVVGIPDEKWGEMVAAVIVNRPGSNLSAEKVLTHCRTKLHKWKCPKKIIFKITIPKNTMGKIVKEEIKKCFSKA